MSAAITQEKIDELVERFYEKLLKDSYYVSMFQERNVDIELLKSRQRTFISNLVSPEEGEHHVTQVKERHSFQISPDRAQIWMGTMKETINEMDFNDDIKNLLITKIEFLVGKIAK